MTAPQSPTPDPVDNISLNWGLSDSAGVASSSLPASSAPPPSPARAETPGLMLRGLVDEVNDTLPRTWSSYMVEIAIAGTEHLSRAIVELPGRGLAPLSLPTEVFEMAAAHRQLAAAPVPWMWLRISQTRGAEPSIVAFDGFVGAPPAHLMFSADTYRTDLSTAPETPKPLWLLAHLNNRGEQLRSATLAAQADPADTVDTETELPPLDLFWPRFAALAAVFASLDADDGPRMNSSLGVFRGEAGGCTLSRLPGGRAVLSGGSDHSALMTAAYNGQMPVPDFYRGAPSWVNNLVLDERAAAGMLSFCYWWSDGCWSRAAVSGPPQWSMIDEISPGVPGVWTSATTAELVNATLAQAGQAVSAMDCAAYVQQVCDGNNRPELLLSLDGPGISIAEGLATLDLAQEW